MTLREEHADLLAEITALREHVASLDRRISDLQAALVQANDHEAATSEILRVISRSPTDIQPVFEAIVRSAAALCNAYFSAAFRFDGELLHIVAATEAPGMANVQRLYPRRPDRETFAGRVVLARAVVHVTDFESDPDVSEASRRAAADRGYRSMVGVPMLRHDDVIGVINVGKSQPGPFAEQQVALLQTFAEQAVIAIENARQFQEQEAGNRDLREALEQQTATSEILRVISGSPTDVQPVLDAVAEAAARLCGANDTVIRRVDGDVLSLWAHYGSIPLPAFDDRFPLTPGRVIGRAILERRTIHVHDVTELQARGEYLEAQAIVREVGYRTLLVVPLLREDLAIGAILIRRMEVRPFSEKQIKLLQTFAAQAVRILGNNSTTLLQRSICFA